jgi:porin
VIDAPGRVPHHRCVRGTSEASPWRRACGKPRRGARIALAALGLLVASAAHAEPPRAGLDDSLLYSNRLIGDPAGARSRLDRLGIELQLFYNQYLSGKPEGGGANPDAVFGHSGSYDFLTRVDLEALVGWPGADVLLHVKGQYDRNLDADVGALSDPIDDADFDAGIYVDELWIQQALFADRLRLRLGFSEQQTVFDRNAYANAEDRQFLSSFLDNNAVVPLPNGLAAMLLVVPVPWLEVALGAVDADNRPRRAGFDTAFDSIDSISGFFEVKIRSPWERRGLPGNYRLGVFVDGRELANFRSGRRQRGHVGAYLSVDQLAWRERADGHEGLGLFARAGYADPTVNRVAWFWSVGFEYVGAIPGRNRDVLGVGSYQAIGSASYRDRIDRRFERETGIECYYALRALGWLVITPDFQYIVDPGATGAAGNAFVGTLRFRLSF